MTVNAVLAPAPTGAKRANGAAGDSASFIGDAGQLFAAVLGQWLYALEGAQGQKFMDIVPAGKEANSGIVRGGQEGIIPLLMAGGFAQTGMDGQTSTSTGSELDKYKEQIITLLEKLNGEIVIPRQEVKAGFPNQAQEVQSKLLAQAFNLLQVQNPGLAGAGSVTEPGNNLAMDGQTAKVLVGKGQGGNALEGERNVLRNVFGDKRFSLGAVGGTGQGSPINSELLRDKVSDASLARANGGSVDTLEGQTSELTGNFKVQHAKLAAKSEQIPPHLRRESSPSDSNAEIGGGQEPQHDTGALSEASQASGAMNKSINEAKRIDAQSINPKNSLGLVPGERGASKGYGFRNAVGELDRDLIASGSEPGSEGDKPGSGRIQPNRASAQADPGGSKNDNQPQSGMPHSSTEGLSLEIFPAFGESHTGIAGSNSARLNIAMQALNANNGFLPVWEQIAQTVREHRNRPEVKELQLQLHPAELGKIKVFLHWQDGQVNLQVQASESATGTLVQHSLSDLRQALEQAGVSCGLLQSGLSGGSREQQPETEFFAPAFARQRQDEQDKVLLPEHAYMPADLGGRINYMA